MWLNVLLKPITTSTLVWKLQCYAKHSIFIFLGMDIDYPVLFMFWGGYWLSSMSIFIPPFQTQREKTKNKDVSVSITGRHESRSDGSGSC